MSNKKDDRQFITLGEKKIYFDELSPQGKGRRKFPLAQIPNKIVINNQN